MGHTVGKVAKMFNISRTTLLYYDSKGILSPSERSESGYRIYNNDDIEKLKQILLYKNAGVPLTKINQLISASKSDFISVLMQRLSELNDEINTIKKKQDVIIDILRHVELYKIFMDVDKGLWEKILSSIGLTKEQADRWHADFEKNSPKQHQSLLKALGMKENEIREMRELCIRIKA